MNFEFIKYEKRDRLALITLNRPEVMNALHPPCHEELDRIFNDFAADSDSWVAILTGAGDKAFSAGNDLKWTTQHGVPKLPKAGFGAITRRFDLVKPVIAAVNGFALGGGFEIALACDIVIAADTARFGLPEPRVGLIAGAGGIHRLSRQIPLKQAMGMLLTGRIVSADEGYRLGFVNEVVPAVELLQAAERWASEILECSPLLVQLTKESAHAGLGLPVEEAMARDWDERLPRLLASQDYVEGPKAFSERRKPVWTGS
jgi:crotonobetainyl-CoA hydratase